MMYKIPEAFVQTITQVYGDAGRAWIAELPRHLDAWSERWLLRLGEPFDLSFNYVIRATQTDGSEVVLKAGVPNPELLTELAALRWFDGRGMARVIESDPDQGVMLLERVQPGTMLSTLEDDDETIRIAAAIMRQIWRPIAQPEASAFPDLRRWTRSVPETRAMFAGGSGPFPPGMLDLGVTLLRDLLASQEETVLLHGDLHHYNILRAEREPWLAIDPKGVAGERAFEVSALMHNPWGRYTMPFTALVQRLSRRADILAEALAMDRQRIVAWSLAGMILSICWSYEDHDPNWADSLPIVEALKRLYR